MGWVEQRAQGVVGDGPAVRGVCDEGQPGLGRPGVLVSAAFVAAAGHGRYGFSCLTADWDQGVSGILPDSGPGEPPRLVSDADGSPSPPGQEMRAE